jgi:hypothetical protein
MLSIKESVTKTQLQSKVMNFISDAITVPLQDTDIAPASLTSALIGDEWSASRPGRFTTEDRAPVPIG